MLQALIPVLGPLLDRLPGGKARNGAIQLDRVRSQIEGWVEDPNYPGIICISTQMRDLLASWLEGAADALDPKGKRHKKGNK